MQVQQILKDKADDGVVTVGPGATVAEAARVLSERRIGGVVISEDGQTAQGILSERDIVRQLASEGAEVLSMRVDQLMTKTLQTCTWVTTHLAVEPRTVDRTQNVHGMIARSRQGATIIQ